MELISVVIPVYNRIEIFFKSLESLVSQTYPQLQIIIVDDGSVEDVCSAFERVRATYEREGRSFVCIRQEKNNGAPAARNRGFREVEGEYVIFWDADVIARPTMLNTMYSVLHTQKDISFVYSNFLFGKKLFRGRAFSVSELYKKNFITTTSLMRVGDVVSWDESLKRFQDWDMWLTVVESGNRGEWIDQVLFQVSTGGTMSSWLPSFAYRIPFRWIPGLRTRVKKYEAAREIVLRKHSVSP